MGKGDRPKSGRVTRSQRRAMERSLSNVGHEDLDTQLRSLGLCTKNITGDGNCLFRALSDQYHGTDVNHKAIRQEICEFLKTNEDNYKFFVEDDQSFDHHIELMQQDATFGGNMELAAFAKLKSIGIKVYQPGMIYIINSKEEDEGAEEDENGDTEDGETNSQVLHIAYHSWEHYSSVRNIDGPYSGPPEIKIIKPSDASATIKEEEERDEGDKELSSKEKVVLNSCPGTNIRKIRRLLLKHKGNPDKVIDTLYEHDTKAQVVIENLDDKKEKVIDTIEEVKTNGIAPWEKIEDTGKDEKEKPAIVAEKEEEKVINEEGQEEDFAKKEKPKKLSAAERKKEAKRRQKKAKSLKDKAKAARKAKYKEEKDDATTEDDNPLEIISSQLSMKEMYI